jgi:glycosyltransferase involved in cell wall biosynthesis
VKDISKISVSVIVTTYNSPGALKKVLKGFFLQSRLPDEVVVADDGSGPETAKLVSNFANSVLFAVKHVWQEDRGARVCRARNEAIKAATGEYIIFTDGDCVPNRGKRILLDEKITGGFAPEHANSIGALLKAFLGGHLGNSHHLIRLPMLPAFKGTGLRGTKTCNFGVFRSDVMAVNGFNHDFDGEIGREDSDLAARLFKYGLRRKEHPFAAINYHLWHKVRVSKGPSRNDELFKKNLQDPSYRCRNGIVKEG